MEVVSRELFDQAQQATASAIKVAEEILEENRKLHEILTEYKEQVVLLEKIVATLAGEKEA